DTQRMFFVALLLNAVAGWMRSQSGTSSLRAMVYMDEIFGYFPPTANPPSKPPMLTLLKQARAFGLGCVLATQNPVDLDYKGLSNAGTWFLGRLQTERDKARVIDGLESAIGGAPGFDRATIEKRVSNLTQRVFLMRNVHDDAPVLMRTRWALSYLRGPLTLNEIKQLMPAKASSAASAASVAAPSGFSAPAQSSAATAPQRPVLQAGVTEKFITAPGGKAVTYQPRIGAKVRAHFVDAKAGMDAWESWYYLAPCDANAPDWTQAEIIPEPGPVFAPAPAAGATFAEAPAVVASSRGYKAWGDSLEDHVYRTASLNTFRCPDLKMVAAPGGTESEFRAHLAQTLREKRDAAVDALRRKYASKLDAIDARQRKADVRIEQQKSQASSQTMSTALSVGGSLLGALFGGGRRSSVFGKAATAARSIGQVGKERADVAAAEADANALREQAAAINAELESEIHELEAGLDPATIRIETAAVKPKKADIAVEDLALVWVPVS
ncbi:MAG TPA: hypothetical protein VF277_09325, partial [Steroidobacteraceae bacterium]